MTQQACERYTFRSLFGGTRGKVHGIHSRGHFERGAGAERTHELQEFALAVVHVV